MEIAENKRTETSNFFILQFLFQKIFNISSEHKNNVWYTLNETKTTAFNFHTKSKEYICQWYVFIKCHKGKNYERNHPKRMLCNEYWI